MGTISYKPAQIYQIVNSVVGQAIGSTSLAVTDTSSLVSVGDEVLSTSSNKEAFFNTLCDRIGKVVCDVDQYVSKKRSIYKNAIEYGNAIQMLTYEFGNSSIDRGWAGVNSWDSTTRQSQGSPFDNAPNETVKQYIFKDFAAWEYDTVIPDFQLRTAFTSADAMSTFIAGIYIVKANKLALDVEALGNVAVGRAMLECYKKATHATAANANLFVNILAKYNHEYLGLDCTASDGTISYPTGWVMASKALTDKGFLKYLSMFVSQRVKQFGDYTRAFNIEGHTTFCEPIIEINTFVAQACKYNLEADTYHNELVSLGDRYNEISYWQASGDGTTQYDFSATSKINIQDNSTASNHRYAINNVVGFIYDPKAIMITVEDYRSHALYNPKDEVTNTYDKSNIKYAVIPYRDMCVLQIADPTASGSTVDYKLTGVATKS